MLLKLYRFLMRLCTPLIPLLLTLRARQRKENPARRHERYGRPSIPRPNGYLLWIHAASIGESVSILPLVERILQQRPGASVLLTTQTVSSAALMAKRLPKGAIHQFVPIDHPIMVRRFLDHWQPDAAFFVESELWPNLIDMTHSRDIPLALVNARMSERSFTRWHGAPAGFRQALIGAFDMVLAQDEQIADYFRQLGAQNVIASGNLKFAAPPLGADAHAVSELEKALGDRPCWLAASTHPGEDELIAEAHRTLKMEVPNVITIIVPRHERRGVQIASMLRTEGLVTRLRSSASYGGLDRADVYIGDTTGEMGLFYRVCNIVLMGGSLVPHGGQNPLEPARLNCAILHGPHVENFEQTYQNLDEAEATELVSDPLEIAGAVLRLMRDGAERKQRADRAARIGFDNSRVLDRVVDEINPILNRKQAASQ